MEWQRMAGGDLQPAVHRGIQAGTQLSGGQLVADTRQEVDDLGKGGGVSVRTCLGRIACQTSSSTYGLAVQKPCQD